MQRIRVGHDNSGLGAAWHLNRVEVTNSTTGQHTIFPCNRQAPGWLLDLQRTMELWRTGSIPGASQPLQGATSARGGCENESNLQLQHGCFLSAEGSMFLIIILPQSPCRWFSKKDDDYQIERDLFPSDAADLNIDWQVSVKTSDIKGAGTDANVFCILIGEQGALASKQAQGRGGKRSRGCHTIEQTDNRWAQCSNATPSCRTGWMARMGSRLPITLSTH